MEYVIDASVVAKWLFIEEDTPKARLLRTRFFTSTDQPLALNLLLSEVSNVIWKYQQQGVITEGLISSLYPRQCPNTQKRSGVFLA